MSRIAAAALAALVTIPVVAPAARAQAQAAKPFPVVRMQTTPAHRHTWAYVTLAGGVTLIGLSFLYSHRADDEYAAYLASTNPEEIPLLYSRAVRSDHRAQATLLSGEVLVATGIYLRFVRRPARSRVALLLAPSRCAVSCRF